MAKSKLVDSILNSNDNESEPIISASSPIDTKKYMYKPLGFKDSKRIYGKMSYVKKIFEENKSNGWFDTIPEGAIIQ